MHDPALTKSIQQLAAVVERLNQESDALSGGRSGREGSWGGRATFFIVDVTLAPPATPWLPGGRQCQSPR